MYTTIIHYNIFLTHMYHFFQSANLSSCKNVHTHIKQKKRTRAICFDVIVAQSLPPWNENKNIVLGDRRTENLPTDVQVCQRKTKLRTLYLQLTCDKEQ